MLRKKDTLLVGFALFSLFFGAGNLILPPYLGFTSGIDWWVVTLGFVLTGVVVPIFGIVAHARLQGTLFDVGKKVSPTFSLIYAYLIYLISILLPAPRTAAVTHEIAIAPLFNSPSWLSSTIYFALVFVFALNRSKVLSIIGKFLTPAILLILAAIIISAIVGFDSPLAPSSVAHGFSTGFLEGYQTFDAIAAVVVGGVIIISVNLDFKQLDAAYKRKLIARAGLIAGLGLFAVYAGLIYTGARLQSEFIGITDRTALLSEISIITLGNIASLLLSVLVSLACFTTAVGIITGTADFMKGRCNESQSVYIVTVALCCLIGLLVGQFNVEFIIKVAVPALMFIYPVTIILILLNVVPDTLGSPKVFKWVTATAVLFSTPDFLATIGYPQLGNIASDWLPLAKFQMGWILPCMLIFAIVNATKKIGA
ncbi:branched-chain amino acid transport system II carrier protein [Croceivirga sp. JEA036]|uniref:branched-chain amino acid transport system II carrier protein n=1 Tax=Croceivirga sp. JEA036 TaxID=2721162 RepID=UPI00143C11F9|nr:branched-chain amino acid transport system II carrier protein [Croceivirga sp. JEA036]NJB37146.1 branched-chain amino acid transport system II carrier protein [Croceivirga sp. JEA036]